MAIPTKTDTFLETEVDGEILLVDLAGGELMSMTGTARAIWLLIDGRRSDTTIVKELEKDHDGVEAREVADFLGQLATAGLISRG